MEKGLKVRDKKSGKIYNEETNKKAKKATGRESERRISPQKPERRIWQHFLKIL